MTAMEKIKSVTVNNPIKLNRGTEVKNRIVKAAMSESLGSVDGRPTKALTTLYKRWAEGGAGLLITGNVMIDRRAFGEPNNVVIEDDADLPQLSEWAQAATSNDTQCWVQLNHPGKQAPKGLNKETVSPSAVPFRQEMQNFFSTPRALENSEILDIIKRFGTAAKVVKDAGFSGVMIHGAHGYLVSQFLSPLQNLRTDKWGGNSEARRQFVLEIYREVRRQVGNDFPIAIKLNSADFQKGGFSEEESLNVIKALEAEGIDLVEISGGSYEQPAMSGVNVKESTKKREAYFLEFAEKIRAETKIPLILTGGFRTTTAMNDALKSGALDFVGMARAFAIDPEYANKSLQGKAHDIQVKPIKTGLKPIDNMGIMEVSWYSRQLHRMGKGKDPKPNESPLMSFIKTMFQTRMRVRRKNRAS